MSGKNNNIVFGLLSLAYITLLFFNCQMLPLLADEPIRALGALEMEITDSWIPTMYGEVYLNKPPLYNWILLFFFKITGNHSELIVRLPALLSLLIFGWSIYHFTYKLFKDKTLAFFSAFATLTTGNILFYSSLLGHIDALFSAIVFSQLMLLYLHGKNERWWLFFLVSFGLTFIGFLLKGLPSFVFQGISVIVLLFHFKALKKLFSIEGIVSFFLFLGAIVTYFYIYSHYVDLKYYIDNLWSESSKRTVLDKSLLESIAHIFTFPGQYVLDTLLFSLLFGVFLIKKLRAEIIKHPILKAFALLFLANILIYWLSPDNRARYIFMLYPFPFIITLYLYLNNQSHGYIQKMDRVLRVISMAIHPIIISVIIYRFEFVQTKIWPLIVYGIFILVQVYFYRKALLTLVFLSITILGARFLFDAYVIPYRSTHLPNVKEKAEALEIARIVGNQKLAMHYSNMHLNMVYYVTSQRMKILPIKDDDDTFYLDEYYLIPTDVLKDSMYYESYFTFVRGFENKPFELIKFKTLPRKKSKHEQKNITGNTGAQRTR